MVALIVPEKIDHVLGEQRIDGEARGVKIDETDDQYCRADNDTEAVKNDDCRACHDGGRRHVILGAAEQERPRKCPTEVAVARDDRPSSLQVKKKEAHSDRYQA